MKYLLWVGAGSFLGGMARYWLSQFFPLKTAVFPFATLFINITGCFLIGIVYALAEKHMAAQAWRLFIATGLLGGFTTFSAFSFETVYMIRNDQAMYAILYVLASVLIGIAATFFGAALIR